MHNNCIHLTTISGTVFYVFINLCLNDSFIVCLVHYTLIVSSDAGVIQSRWNIGDVIDDVKSIHIMKIALISSVYGEEFHKASLLWVQHNKQYLPKDTEICLVSLDGEKLGQNNAAVKYIFSTKNKEKLGWGDGDLARLEQIIKYCSLGYTCLHMDLDAVLFKTITPILDLPYSFIISRAFGFPKSVVEKMGFVGCTGFYIAKPSSLPFLLQWCDSIRCLDQLDQLTINNMFSNLDWKNQRSKIDPYSIQNSLASWKGISILVLASTFFPRGKNKICEHSFGVHNPYVMQEYWKL